MINRVFVSAVVALWLGSMTWLVVDRILPSLFSGNPPRVSAYNTGEVVAWRVHWDKKPVGWAGSVRLEGEGGTTELHNRVVMENLPLMELAPFWMRQVMGSVGELSFDALTRIEIDSLGNFSAFESRISLNDVPSVLSVQGRVRDSQLELQLRSGVFSSSSSVYMPNSKALSEALFPGARLPLMYVGRSWCEEVYSPFHAPGDPVKVVQAKAVSTDSMFYQGKIRRVVRVEYRAIVGAGVKKNAQLQAVSWVDRGGDVLRHDVFFAGAKMRFERLDKNEAAKVGVDLFERLTRQGAEINLPEPPAEAESKKAQRPAA
ncbi:MAG: hypothetical protein GXP26_17400 [Planctomycetes bacterium]|nr:hypothetical protein [Planctomycetota bacterium]